MNITPALLEKLHSQYGPSFYLFVKNKFESNLEKFKFELDEIYPNVKIAYSVKTNYMPAVCKLARQFGAFAEVVSGLEYEVVKKVGFKGDEIIFNGPVKEKEELWEAFEDGAIVQFDSYEEIKILKNFINKFPEKKVRCALRCTFDIGESEISRFGFDVDSGEAESVYHELFMIDGCEPVGIHCHFNTSHRSLDSFYKRTKRLIETANLIFKERKPEYINIGGGFFGELSHRFKKLFPNNIPSNKEYGEVIGSLMKNNYPDCDVCLIAEPGVSVVADTMIYICRVYSIKHIASKPVITLTGSIHNIRPNPSDREVPFRIIKGSNHNQKVVDGIIGGYTCLESDLITSSFTGEISVGDYLIFENTGAYNLVLKPPFIKGSPPIIMTDVNSSTGNIDYEVVKIRESASMMLASYKYSDD